MCRLNSLPCYNCLAYYNSDSIFLPKKKIEVTNNLTVVSEPNFNFSL